MQTALALPSSKTLTASGLARQKAPKRNNYPLTTGKKLIVLAMLDAGVSVRDIELKERISSHSIRKIRDDARLREVASGSESMEQVRKSIGNSFYYLADVSLQKASQESRLNKMNSYQLTGIASLAYDKARLADGLSTENISIRGVVGHIQNEVGTLRKMRQVLEADLAKGESA